MKKNIKTTTAALSITLLISMILSGGGINDRAADLTQPTEHIKITAHRGDRSAAPENTIESVRLAMHNEVDSIEIDIQETQDCQLVVIHDENIERVTGVDLMVADLTLDQLKGINSGIPSLAEVFLLLMADEDPPKLNLEIKADPHGHIGYQISSLIRAYEMFDYCYVTSENLDLLKQVDYWEPDIPLGLVCNKEKDLEQELDGLSSLSINKKLLTRERVMLYHGLGLEVHAYTVDKKDDVRRMIALGVDNIITDNPPYVSDVVHGKVQ